MKNSNNTINVSSENQQGGITAGIVNIFKKRKVILSENDKTFITEKLNNKSGIVIHVSLQGGSGSELMEFSIELKKFLESSGYSDVRGVHTIMGFAPFQGVTLEEKSPTEYVFFIGAIL